MASIRIGTSGWSYPTGAGTWNGVFYPRPRPRGFDELRFYSQRFSTVEINATFYGQPKPEIAAQWVERTPADFDFALKLYQKFTHPKMFREREQARAPGVEGALLDWLATVTPADLDEFRRGVDPIARSGKLGALLAQFPASFKYDARTVDYLDALLRAFSDYPMAVELRHRSWSEHHAETLSVLGAHGAAFVQIDEPKFRTSIRQNQLPNVSAYYMRLHGRNAQQWWQHAHKDDRYDYLYAVDELQTFAETLTSAQMLVKRDVRAYLNNHYSAKGIVNAAVLQQLVREPVRGDFPESLRERYSELMAHVPRKETQVRS